MFKLLTQLVPLLPLVYFLCACGKHNVEHHYHDGLNGQDGYSAVIGIVNSAPGCPAGGITILSALDVNRNNVVDIGIDEDVYSQYVCNGMNGTDATGFTSADLVDPCGDNPLVYDEVFLRLSDGTLVASFSDNASGRNTRFSVLIAGNYITTDGDICRFTVNANGEITNEHH